MNNSSSDSGRRQPTPQDIWKLALAAIAVIAIVQELRKPASERTWHGKVGFVPYDLRKPTVERVRETYWNPDGPVLSRKLWGAGWALNFGAVIHRFTRSSRNDES